MSLSSLAVFCLTASATSGFSTLSLHDALPISTEGAEVDVPASCTAAHPSRRFAAPVALDGLHAGAVLERELRDRKSTRLNSSHVEISYAVFCVKKKIFELPVRSVVLEVYCGSA